MCVCLSWVFFWVFGGFWFCFVGLVIEFFVSCCCFLIFFICIVCGIFLFVLLFIWVVYVLFILMLFQRFLSKVLLLSFGLVRNGFLLVFFMCFFCVLIRNYQLKLCDGKVVVGFFVYCFLCSGFFLLGRQLRDFEELGCGLFF